MISRDDAKLLVRAFRGHPGADLATDETKTRLVDAFMQCTDEAHGKRTQDLLLDGFRLDDSASRFFPCVADVHVARERTFLEGERTYTGCEKCKGAGLWSRDTYHEKSGCMIGVCGPCPDCAAGRDRALAEHSRKAAYLAKMTEQGQEQRGKRVA